MEKGTILENRRFVIGGIILVVIIAYVWRLAVLQLFSDEYQTKAEHNAYYRSVIYPSRGNIYDRNGERLVYNQTAFDVMVTMRDLRERIIGKDTIKLDTAEFCKSMGITRTLFDKRMADIKDSKLNPGYTSVRPQLFVGQLSEKEYSVIQEKLIRYPGFSIRKRAVRKYATPLLAHVLGDVGEVSKADIEKDDYYSPGDFIGVQGVERSYEKELRGEKGIQILLRDARGIVHGHYRDGKEDVMPKAGKDVTLSIDENLQALGERLMHGKHGAIVAIEPKTGEILCAVSAPSYDPRLLEGKERGKYMSRLLKDKSNPLLNRATLGFYPPGSTFKPTQALTFLQEHIITNNTYYPCQGGFKVKGLTLRCHAHKSPISLTDAVATSCNGYFCWGLYHMFNNRTQYKTIGEAMTKWKNYMVRQGFGYRLGTDLPSEGRGLIPNAQYYDDHFKGKWNAVSVVSISIGQGEVLATPLQIANLGATIANRGKYKIPHVVHAIQDGQLADSLTVFKNTGISPYYYDMVIQGMRSAVLRGTCTSANLPGIEVCGKTGTAENSQGEDHSAFLGFAPMNDPKIAICVYVENGGWGATYGVPIGALMIEQYLRGKLSPSSEERAELYASKIIDYNKKKDEDKTIEKAKPANQHTQTADTARESVFHKFGTYHDSIMITVNRLKHENQRRQQQIRDAIDRKQAEEMERKEAEAREKAEIRQKAELARQKAAEIRRQEDEEKERKRKAYKKKQKEVMDKAIETDWIIRQMKKKINE